MSMKKDVPAYRIPRRMREVGGLITAALSLADIAFMPES